MQHNGRLQVVFSLALLSCVLQIVLGQEYSLSDCQEAVRKEKFAGAVNICQTVADTAKKQQDRIAALFLSGEANLSISKRLSALRNYLEILKLDPNHQGALQKQAETSLALGDLQMADEAVKRIRDKGTRKKIWKSIRMARWLHSLAERETKRKQHKVAKRLYGKLLEYSPDSSVSLSRYADCFIHLNEYQRALDILKRESGLAGDSSESYFLMAKILLAQGNLDGAKRFLNGALNSNPDIKGGMPLRSKIRQIESLLQEANDGMLIKQSVSALEELKKELSDNPVEPKEKYYDERFPYLFRQAFTLPIDSSLCIKYSRLKNPLAAQTCKSAIALCTSIESKKELQVALIESLLTTDIEEAVQVMKTVQGENPGDQQISKLAKKVAEAHRKSKMKDYYAILGITKEASDKDVRKAYKRLSKLWHPDKHSANPKPAEEKMRDINRAHEILSDPEKRRIYDMHGYDPDDPEAQQANAGFGGFGGFGAGGFPGFDFGGGQGFEFVFRDAQGREWRQQGSGGRHGGGHHYHHHNAGNQKRQQRQQQNWRWDDL